MIEIVDALGVTAVTASGSPPKLNLTDSPSSSSLSCVASKVMVFDVSPPDSNVTLSGTE